MKQKNRHPIGWRFCQYSYVSAYIISITMEVVHLFYPLSSEYIKYLNDPDCNGMTYDQWKERKMRQELEKNKKGSDKKNHYNGYPKYDY
jgi:hypothetical protein